VKPAPSFVRRLFNAVLLVPLLGAPVACAQALSAADASVKLAFVYNLAKFTEWPAQALGPSHRQIAFCLAGDAEPYAAGLAALEGRTLASREVRVRHLGRAGDAAGCHILYIARGEERRAAELLAQAHPQAVLTASDIADFAEADGIIGFVNVDNRVQFEINLRSARAANLKLSSEVLKLARTVIGK
jgi:hypothetical protein